MCDNFVKKWDTFYRPRVIALAKRDFPAVQQVIADFEESSGDGKSFLSKLMREICSLHHFAITHGGEFLCLHNFLSRFWAQQVLFFFFFVFSFLCENLNNASENLIHSQTSLGEYTAMEIWAKTMWRRRNSMRVPCVTVKMAITAIALHMGKKNKQILLISFLGPS